MKSITYIAILLTLSFVLQSCMIDFNRHKIENWYKLRATGEAACAKHDYVTARKSFEEALKIAAPIKNEPARLAITLEELSKVCLATNDLPLATSIFDQALALANKRSQTSSKQLDVIESELGQCLINVAKVFAKEKKYAQAAVAFREARALLAGVYKKSSPALPNFITATYLALSIDGLGTSYKEMGQLKEARQAYFSVKDYNLIDGLSIEVKDKLVEDFCTIPDTSQEEKEKYAATLGTSI